jgi:hypothetical protein
MLGEFLNNGLEQIQKKEREQKLALIQPIFSHFYYNPAVIFNVISNPEKLLIVTELYGYWRHVLNRPTLVFGATDFTNRITETEKILLAINEPNSTFLAVTRKVFNEMNEGDLRKRLGVAIRTSESLAQNMAVTVMVMGIIDFVMLCVLALLKSIVELVSPSMASYTSKFLLLALAGAALKSWIDHDDNNVNQHAPRQPQVAAAPGINPFENPDYRGFDHRRR